MEREELEKRTKRFALDIIRLVKAFHKDKAADVIAYQLLRSGTSIGANYREATRAESKADFVHKLGLVQKEANETVYWLDLVQESEMINRQVVAPILSEAKELLAIFGASHKTAANR
jgi:four helix bundle protein